MKVRHRLLRLVVVACALAVPALCLEALRARPSVQEEPTWVYHGCEAIRDFLQSATGRTLDPWLARRRQWTKEEIKQVIVNLGHPNGSFIPNYSPQWNGNNEMAQQVVPFFIFEGVLYLHHPMRKANRGSRIIQQLDDLRDIAEKFPQLATEGFVSFDEEGRNWDLDTFPPAWSFERHRDRYDIMAPHYYVRPDELCDAERLSERDPGDDRKRRTAAVVATPWEKRERRVFARYSPFCHGAGIIINKTEFTACPRVHFAWLGYNYTEVNDIPLDIAITLGDEKEKLLIKPGVPYQDFGKSAPGAFANALALGSVVLKQRTAWEQFFDSSLVPWQHYVPLLDYTTDDLLGKVAWLDQNPRMAARIARAGREFACAHMTEHARSCYYRAATHQYNRFILAYDVDAALLAERRAQFPDGMYPVTRETLACAEVNSPRNGCQWRGPRYKPPFDPFGDVMD